MDSNRLLWIDVLKFLSIFGIIGIHVSSIFSSVELFSSVWYQSVCLNSLFRFAIVTFIMTSGYLILRKQQDMEVIPRRFKRIVLPFVFWYLIYAVVKVLFKGVLGSNWNLMDLLSYMVRGFLDPTIVSVQFWYVYMILGLYVLSPILSRWIQNAPIREVEYALIIWVFFSMLHFMQVDSILLDYFRYFTGAIGYFVLGYYLSIKKSQFLDSRSNGLKLFVLGSLITIVGTIVLSLVTGSQSLFFIQLGDITPGSCLQGIGVYLIVKNTDFSNLHDKALEFIEKVSVSTYNMYLSNVLIINFLGMVHIIDYNGFTSLRIIVYVVVVLLLSYLCTVVMEKVPVVNKFL